MKTIEVELRALIDKKKYFELKDFLIKNGKYLGKDNKDTYFFLFPDKLLKVTNNITTSSAKLTLKLNKIGIGSDFKEIEIPIAQKDVSSMLVILKLLGFNKNQYSFQFRDNYLYKDINIALKYTQSWGFHVELEIMIENKQEIENAKENITKIANELGLEIMNENKLKDFTNKIDSGWVRGEFTKEQFEQKLR